MPSTPQRPLILIVDDDQDTRDMYAFFLDLSGLHVLTAADADSGFSLALEHEPDLVVTDLMLGGRNSGVELCRRLRNSERTAHIPAVLLTGSTRKSDTDAAQLAGCGDVRLKPYLPDALLSDIRQILARPRNERLAG
jgi:CheY-like chemotaxis protein